MRVMSKSAAALLDKMKEYTKKYTNSPLEYDIIDIEWFAHRYKLSLIEGWWQEILSKKGVTPVAKHTWWLPNPEINKGFRKWVDKLKHGKYEFEWTEELKQIYCYLCSVLTSDFNLDEFKRIIQVGNKYTLKQIQKAVKTATEAKPVWSVAYLLAILDAEVQSKNVRAERITQKIDASQSEGIKLKAASRIDALLMRVSFTEIQNGQNLDHKMEEVKR